MSVEYTKNLVGKPIVKFDCPKCHLRLSAMLAEAGTHDTCPECGQAFRVPGTQQLKKAQEKRKLEKEAKALAKQQRQEEAEKVQEKEAEDEGSHANLAEQQPVDERWLVEPDQESGSMSDSSGVAFVPPVPERPRGDTASSTGSLANENPRRVTPPTGGQAWWKDSVRFESVASSRYPALMAFRNVLVLLWWVMVVGFVIGFVFYPMVLLYGGYATYSTSNQRFDRQAEKYDNQVIEGLLQKSGQGQGLNASEARILEQEFSRSDYRGFPLRSRVMAGRPVTASVLGEVDQDWRQWTQARKDEINEDRPSAILLFLMALLYILVFWLAQILALILYSIIMLVPPECIKLAIDIEYGVRTGNETASA